MDFDFTVTGTGPAIIFIHGWPFTNESFRKIIPAMSEHFTCYALNSLGMAHDGVGSKNPQMNFSDHARRLISFADAQGLKTFSLLGHDTGATIARIVAANAPKRVNRLVLLNTEIPGHRPPFIPFYQKSIALPGSRTIMRALLSTKFYRNSAMGYGNTVADKSLIDSELKPIFIDYFMNHPQRFEGMRRYLMGLDFSIIDTLNNIHAKISAPTQFIWGKDDQTFPYELGRKMAASMPACKEFIAVENACFLPQEECPKDVSTNAIRFLTETKNSNLHDNLHERASL